MAIGTVHAVDYLLTWNCKHIANAATLPKVYRLLTNMGYSPPLSSRPRSFLNMSEPIYEDLVVAEIHAIRAQMLAECGGDHHKLMEKVREHERTSGRRVIPAPPPAMPAVKPPAAVPDRDAGVGA
jgi:hypothetical protein